MVSAPRLVRRYNVHNARTRRISRIVAWPPAAIQGEAVDDMGAPGAYGLALVGEAGDDLVGQIERGRLVAAPPSWPRWHVAWRPLQADDDPPEADEWDGERARILPLDGGWTELDRRAARTVWHRAERPGPEPILHPSLSSTAVIANHWLGHATFHGGVFAVDGRAWAVLADRDVGKSSLLMALHVAGVPVVADDLVVVSGGGTTVCSGPRCLDLRQPAAEHFGAGRAIGFVGTRERWRVDLPPVPAELPFAGWVVLGWADEVVVADLPAAARLHALAANRGLRVPGLAPHGLLDLATRPTVLFGRPRDWDRLQAGVDRLVQELAVS